MEELASFIESHLSELDETYELVEKLQSMVRSLEDNIWSGDNTYLKNILLDINTRLLYKESFFFQSTPGYFIRSLCFFTTQDFCFCV